MKKVVWESQHFDFDALTGHLSKDMEDFESYDEEESGEMQKLMHTPFGMFSVDDSMNPYRQFQFWLAHTNFNIDDNTAYLIENTPGVEVLKILTRYRFIIAIGKLFDTTEVKYNVQKAITDSSPEDSITNLELKSEISQLKRDLVSTGESWAIYVFPNGQVDYFSTKNKEEYVEKLKLYKDAKERSGGILIYE